MTAYVSYQGDTYADGEDHSVFVNARTIEKCVEAWAAHYNAEIEIRRKMTGPSGT